LAIKLWVNVELLLIEKQVNKLNEKNVNDTDDSYIVLPGPDVKVANNNHEDIENDTKESEIVETALDLESYKMV
jgi:hypothetical protein